MTHWSFCVKSTVTEADVNKSLIRKVRVVFGLAVMDHFIGISNRVKENSTHLQTQISQIK